MKIVLVNPPRDHELVGNNPPLIDEERGFNPPLGLLYLAASILDKTSHEVEVIDAQAEDLDYPALKSRLEAARPEMVGVTAMTFTLLDALAAVRLAKEISGKIITVVGGIHAFLYPEETAALEGVDFVLQGEGELSFVSLLEEISLRRKPEAVPGVVFQRDGGIIRGAPPSLIKNLDELPFPARRLTPWQRYSSVLSRRSPITTMFTSRGCPYRCSFCSRPHLGKVFRFRHPANVVDEMQACQEMGINEILFYDDTFSVNRPRVIDICREIIGRGLKIGWDIRARVDCVDEETLAQLKQANCQRIHYGIEAGTEKILKVLNKGITLEQARKAVRLTKRAGIQTLAYFMIGSPTENREDVKKTMDFALELNPDFVHITITTPFPATDIYQRGLREGLFKTDHWLEFARQPRTDFSPPYWNENFSDPELQDLLRNAYRKFYSRPRFILKELFQPRSFSALLSRARTGWKILTMKKDVAQRGKH